MKSKSYDAFLSHASPDAAIASKLAILLRKRCSIYLQKRDGPLGYEWQPSIANAIRESIATIVLASGFTGKAFYQKAEIDFAMNLSRDHTERHFILPIFLPGYVATAPESPFGLSLFHGIDVSPEANWNQIASCVGDDLIAKRPEAIPSGTLTSDKEATPSGHYLLKFTVGPMVRDIVILSLPEAYAELIGERQVKALFAGVNHALEDAAKQDGTRAARISLAEFPALTHVGGITFWTDVFYNLAAKGPRALAAMMLAVPDDLFHEDAKGERAKILSTLEWLSTK